MDVAGWIDQIEVEGQAIAVAAAEVPLDSAVGHCPGWAVRDLLAHVGTVHRWAAAIVGTPRDDPAVPAPDLPGDDDLIAWYAAGHAALLETLRGAPADLACWSFLPAPSPLAFWARRQALETAVHRVDLQLAAGPAEPIEPDLALDGLVEMLTGFGRRKRAFAPGTIRLAPADADAWLVTLGADGLSARSDDPGTPADVTVAGTASDVYRWTWNRPAKCTITGDASIAEQWQQIRVRWS